MKNDIFWPTSRTKKATRQEAEKFNSPQETGKRLVAAIEAWLVKASAQIPDQFKPWFEVNAPLPDEFSIYDPGLPQHAMHLCRVMVAKVNRSVPAWWHDMTPGQAQAVKVIHAISEAVKSASNLPPESAVIVLGRSIALGIELARAHTHGWQEPAHIGKRQTDNAIRMHAGKHGTAAEKAVRWAGYEAAVKKALRDNPSLSLTRARAIVAAKLGVSERTVRDHTRSLSAKKKARKVSLLSPNRKRYN